MRADLESSLAPFAADVETLYRRLAADRVVERLWRGDASLWHSSADTRRRIEARLGWLDLPNASAELARQAAPVPEHTPLTVVAPDFAGSMYRLWSCPGAIDRERVVLDSVDPWSLPERLPPAALRLATAQTRSIELETLLALQSGEIIAPPNVESRIVDRWATMSGLGWTAARLAGHNVSELVSGAAAMRRRCQLAHDLGGNPGLELGLLLAVMAQRGRDKLTLLAAPSWQPLADWITAFVGSSLCKHRRGFVPIADEPRGALECYGADRCFIVIDSAATPDDQLHRHAAALAAAGHPVIRFGLAGPADVAAEVVRWQVGVAICASIIGVNPFDEPDVDALQAALRQRVSAGCPIDMPPGATPDDAGRQLRFHVPGTASRTVLIAAYFTASSSAQRALDRLRHALLARGIASAVLWPWRDGTLATQAGHAGRADNLVLALRGRLPPESEPRRAALTRLAAARVVIDQRSWQASGRRMIDVELGRDLVGGLDLLASVVGEN